MPPRRCDTICVIRRTDDVNTTLVFALRSCIQVIIMTGVDKPGIDINRISHIKDPMEVRCCRSVGNGCALVRHERPRGCGLYVRPQLHWGILIIPATNIPQPFSGVDIRIPSSGDPSPHCSHQCGCVTTCKGMDRPFIWYGNGDATE
jgi:hypothetical protein